MSKPTAEEIVQRIEAQKAKIRSIFSSGAGKEVLDNWKAGIVHAKLFHDDERTTAYVIGQRDFVLEIISIVEGEE